MEPKADGGERAETALFAVSVRSTARVGRHRHVAISVCSFSSSPTASRRVPRY